MTPTQRLLPSGKLYDLANPTADGFTSFDIIVGLSSINRFLGALKTNITVARHSVAGWVLCEDPEVKPYMLMHDFHEALVGDLIRPVYKALGPEFEARWRTLTHHLDLKIWEHYGYPPPSLEIQQEVSRIDNVLCDFELSWYGNEVIPAGTECVHAYRTEISLHEAIASL